MKTKKLIRKVCNEIEDNFYDIQDAIPELFGSNNSLLYFTLWNVLQDNDKKEVKIKNMENDYIDLTSKEEIEQESQEQGFDLMRVCEIPFEDMQLPNLDI